MRYRFICQRQDYSVSKWARYLGVSLSGYHAWKRDKARREANEEAYRREIRKVFEDHKCTYGADRICGVLRRMGYKASYRKVLRLMRSEGLYSIHRRNCVRSLTNSKKSRGEVFLNLVKGLPITQPFQVLSSDISYIRTREGFEYLCEVRDVFSGMILSMSMSSKMRTELVENAIQQAVKCWDIPHGSIFHSDRGSQYTSHKVRELLSKSQLRQSFSRVGKPGDNAWSESFFANLKKEAVHWTQFSTREEAREAMFAYIEGFYNTKRVQKRLGYLSPLQWLDDWLVRQHDSVA